MSLQSNPEQHQEIDHPLVPPNSYSKELSSMPSRIAISFVTPPPHGLREFTSYIARGLPPICLTTASLLGMEQAIDFANSYTKIDPQSLLALKGLSIALATLPLGTACIRITREFSNKIDSLIMK